MALAKGLQKLDIEFIFPEDERLPQLNTICIPEGIDDAKAPSYLLDHYNFEMDTGLGVFAGKAWRMGLIGHAEKIKM